MSTASNFTMNNGAITPVATLFTSVQPASGNLPAIYVAKSTGPAMAFQAKVQVSSKGGGKKRETLTTITVPYWVLGADGVNRIVDTGFVEIRTVLADSLPDAVRRDLAAFTANSLDAAQIRESQETGFAPA